MKTGTELIAEERARQVLVCGYTPEHDDRENTHGELVLAAVTYAFLAADKRVHALAHYPWNSGTLKPDGDRVRTLAKAGALIASAIDQINRSRLVKGDE